MCFLPCIRILFLRIKQKTKVRKTANLLTQDFTSAYLYVSLCCSAETHVTTPLLSARKRQRQAKKQIKKVIVSAVQTIALNPLKTKRRLLY